MDAKQVAENYCVSEQIEIEDIPGIVAAGIGTVICNRPDYEEPGQPLAADIATECEKNGISYHYLPFQGPNLTADIVGTFREILKSSGKPVLGYCRSGQRSAFLHATAYQDG